MPDDSSQTQTIDRIVGLRLRQLQQATGLPAVFGGATSQTGPRRHLLIGHARGTLGQSLLDLRVEAGRGLGGSAIETGELRTVRDYASTPTITHDFDGIVVQEERIRSIFALPLLVGGVVGGVVYGAMRGSHRIGDAVLERATSFGASLQREINDLLAPAPDRPPPPRHDTRAAAALDELDALAATATDPRLHERLSHLVGELRATLMGDDAGPRPSTLAASGNSGSLAPREVEALHLVAVGMSNSEVANAMGLSTETVRAYLRSAMRRLDVHNRTAAVHAARSRGLLQGSATT